MNGKGFKNAWAGKVAVLGLLERHPEKGKSKIRTKAVDTIRTYRLHGEVSANVEDGSMVYTDGVPVDNERAQAVEDEILPKLQALIELSEADDPSVVQAAVDDCLMAAAVALS